MNRSKGRILHKGLILISVPLFLGIIFVGIISASLKQLAQEIQHELRFKEGMSTTDRLIRAQMVARACAIEFNAIGHQSLKAKHKLELERSADLYKQLRILLRDEPDFQKELSALGNDLLKRKNQDSYLMNCQMPTDPEQLKQKYSEQIEFLGKQKESAAFLFEKLQSSASNAAVSAHNSMFKIQITLISGVVISILFSIASLVYFSRNISYRLLNVVSNTNRLAEGQKLNPPMQGDDEIAELDRLLFQSANEIKEHERFQNALLAIVSHELKTPLSSVSGIFSALSQGIFGEIEGDTLLKVRQAEKHLQQLMERIKGILKRDGEGCNLQFSLVPFSSAKSTPAESQAVWTQEKKRGTLSLKIWQKCLVLISVPLIFELVFSAVLGTLLIESRNVVRREEKSQDMIVCTNRIMNKLLEADNEVATYFLTANSEHLKTWGQIKQDTRRYCLRLRELSAGDPVQQKNAELTEKLLLSSFAGCQRAIDGEKKIDIVKIWRQSCESETAKKYTGEGQIPANNLLSLEIARGQKESNKREKMSGEIAKTLSAAIVLNILLSLLLTVYLMRSITGRVRHVMENTRRLLTKEALQAPLKGFDEIAFLDKFFYQTALYLRKLESRQKELIAVAGAELRLPLSAVQTTLKLLLSDRAGELGAKAQERLKLAEKEIERLLRLTNELLEIKQMETGTIELNYSQVAVEELLQSALVSVSCLVEAKQIRIETDTNSAGMIYANRDRLRQVVINLLSNAIKFSPAGSTIKILARQDSSSLMLFITDQGRGIPRQLQQRIFERFFQVSEADATEEGGSGLGLSIVKSIIEQHAGTVGVDSEVGKGSTFWVSLPLSFSSKPESNPA